MKQQPPKYPPCPPPEPEVRRWPHPICQAEQETDSMLHYIRCALSYQNQQLADIKALLQQVVELLPWQDEGTTEK